MKDSIYLLVTAIIAAGLAWTFWHFTGENGFGIIALVFMVSLGFENRRLKKRIKELEQGHPLVDLLKSGGENPYVTSHVTSSSPKTTKTH